MSADNIDIFKQAAADTLDKPYDEVTREERQRFKVTMFNLLMSERSTFMLRQPDYIQEAFAKYREDFETMELRSENTLCAKCLTPLEPSSASHTHYIYWCPPCDEEVKVHR